MGVERQLAACRNQKRVWWVNNKRQHSGAFHGQTMQSETGREREREGSNAVLASTFVDYFQLFDSFSTVCATVPLAAPLCHCVRQFWLSVPLSLCLPVCPTVPASTVSQRQLQLLHSITLDSSCLCCLSVYRAASRSLPLYISPSHYLPLSSSLAIPLFCFIWPLNALTALSTVCCAF